MVAKRHTAAHKDTCTVAYMHCSDQQFVGNTYEQSQDKPSHTIYIVLVEIRLLIA